ncbi:MAG: regulator of sigma E protease [Dinoroseobacter sp.]|jgi:regulator of sigma E protease
MDFLYSLVGFFIAIGVLVAVHEFGHFWVARKLGVKVLRYSIGFGKPLWKKVHGEDQIEYVIAAIPLGGYVKMLGEGDIDAPVAEHERHRAFDYQPIWKRTLIVAAGPAINFLFAIILFMLLGMMSQESRLPLLGNVPSESIVAKAGGQPGDRILEVDNKIVEFFGQHDLYVFNQVLKGQNIAVRLEQPLGTIKDISLSVADIPIYNISPSFLTRTLGLVPVFPEATTQLDRVLDNSAAAKAGLQPDDIIRAVDGVPISTWQELVEVISGAPDKQLSLDIGRGDSNIRVSATPKSTDFNGETVGRLGIGPKIEDLSPELIVNVERSPWQALGFGVEQTWLMSSVTVRMLWKMLTLQVSHQNISGPITIASVAGQAIQVGLDYYLHILAVISISLGVMNLLPIPMLDGGHLMMYAVESVAGKNVSQKVFAVGQRVGIVFLICLMSLAFYNDIFRLLN